MMNEGSSGHTHLFQRIGWRLIPWFCCVYDANLNRYILSVILSLSRPGEDNDFSFVKRFRICFVSLKLFWNGQKFSWWIVVDTGRGDEDEVQVEHGRVSRN